MTNPQSKALEIATQIVVAKVQTNTIVPNAASGTQTGEFFKVIYDKVLEITRTITD